MGLYRLFLIFLATILLSSCGMGKVLGVDKDEFMRLMNEKEYSFLSEVDYLKTGISEINRLGDGASYYMAFVYKDMDMRLFSNKLLYQEVKKGNPFYREKAIIQLLKQLLAERDYVKVELYATDYIEKYGDNSPQVKKQLIEALYWQKKDSQVVPFINNLDRALYSDYGNYELDLLKCVSSARMDKYNWADQYRSLFFNQPLSPILERAYSFINVFPDYQEPFSRSEVEYFKAISQASGGNYVGAQKILRPLLSSEPWVFETKQSIKNISKIVKDSGYIRVNQSAFSKAIANAPRERRYDGLVSFASLYYKQERFSAVVSILEDEIDSMELGTTRDDAIYLYVLSLAHSDTERVVNKLGYYLDLISDSEYKTPIIDHVITALVQNNYWDSILDIYEIVKREDSVINRSRVSWILTRLYKYGYLTVDNKRKVIEDILEDITLRDDYSYYTYIASALLNKESNLLLVAPPGTKELTHSDKWIDGFVNFGLESEAVTYAKQVEELDYHVAMKVGRLLDRENKHLEALRFLNRHKVPLNSESVEIYYPLPYKDAILRVADDNSIPNTIFSGLIKNESGFDPYVVSSAGAVGLTQLLPGTAAEQAINIGLGDFDINDPETNILLGGTYFNWLVGKFDSLALAAMAYNGGIGNIWRWQNLWGDLPDELFVEASPFKETRDYVPKILRNAIYYGHYEFETEPIEVVREVFPNIN